MIKRFQLYTLLGFISFILVFPVFAQNDPFINIGDRQSSGQIPGVTAVNNPNASPGRLVASTIQIIYIFAGLAALFFFIWGAFDWITAGGDKEKIAAARRKIVNALIGLTLLAITAFIIGLLGEIIGINPLKMGPLPQLGQPPQPRGPTTP